MQSRHDTTTRKELRAPTILEVHGNKDSRDVIRIGRVLCYHSSPPLCECSKMVVVSERSWSSSAFRETRQMATPPITRVAPSIVRRG
jgi:hypothetical protein